MQSLTFFLLCNPSYLLFLKGGKERVGKEGKEGKEGVGVEGEALKYLGERFSKHAPKNSCQFQIQKPSHANSESARYPNEKWHEHV